MSNLTGIAQTKPEIYSKFEPLIGKWKGSGEWKDGTKFQQDVVLEFGLDKTIIKTKTYGNISQDNFKFGLRNEGIRAWSDAENELRFWEFDIFGGITEGTCRIMDKDIFYDYEYDFGQGPMDLTDAWIYADKNTYILQVGVYKDGEWTQTFLSVPMKRTK